MTERLKGKRIVITGAVQNIGRAAVAAFIAEGARVVVGDIDAEGGASVEAEFGESVRFMRVDVTDENSVANFVDAGVGWLGGLDVLAQNAGMQLSWGVEDFDAARFDRLFAVNVRAMFLGVKFAVPHLRGSGRGSIINMASIAGKRGGPGLTAYAASKGAVIAFGTTLALELAPQKIRVNTICPGWIDTPFNDPITGFIGGDSARDAKVTGQVPLGRQGTPAEVAPLYVYLASDESAYVTAQAILVDGGADN